MPVEKGDPSMCRGHRRIIAGLLVATVSTGCYKWGTVGESPAKAIDERSPSKVQLVLSGDSTVVLERVRSRNDTLRGIAPSKTGLGARLHVIPVSEIRTIRVRRFDGLATAGAILGGTVAALGVAVLICAATDCVDIDPLECVLGGC